jgi:uncharacterized protein (DUF1810 family)
MNDPYNLARFVQAQDGIYEQATRELRAGRKESHWMWFIFPQIHGLGTSPTARLYAIDSAAEARAYLDHPVLGPRLAECVQILLGLQGRTAAQIFGFPDDRKLRSCLTLFGAVAGADRTLGALCAAAIVRYFGGAPDPLTLERLL